MRLLLGIFTAFLTLTACGGGNGSSAASSQNPSDASSPASEPSPPASSSSTVLSAKEKIQQLEATGKLPRLDRSLDIQGPDTNGNGVRDDIDNYIAERYKTPEQRAAATQYAASIQASLIVDTQDRAATKANSVRDMRAINCLGDLFLEKDMHFARVSSELLSITTNTKARLKAYLKYDKSLDGTVLSLSNGNTCD